MNVPQLRFSGFDGEWELKKFSEAAMVKGGFAFPSQRFKNQRSKYQVIKMGNLYNNKLDLDRSPSYLESISDRDQEYLLTEGDIIITLTGTVHKTDFGYSHMITNEEHLFVNQRLALIKSKENIDSFFLLNLIRHKRFLFQFFTSSIGGTGNQANVSTKTMESFNIFIPSLLEQKKISIFFTLLNNRINKQREKIEKLEQFKKGMMQKVFSQELRLKGEDCGEFPEWKSLQFGDVVEKLIGGGTPSRSVEEYYGGSIPWVTVKDLKANKYVADAIEYITELGLENSSSKIVDPGDLIIPTRMAVGRILIATDQVAINQDLKGCKLKSEYDTEFIYYLYFSKSATIAKLGSGSTVTGINIEQLMKIKIQVPVLEEQKKIAQYLGSIDKKIDKEKEKLMVLEEQKKGFMWGMFV